MRGSDKLEFLPNAIRGAAPACLLGFIIESFRIYECRQQITCELRALNNPFAMFRASEVEVRQLEYNTS